MSPASVDLDRALGLLALPREVAKHPETGEPILVSIGRFGPYVQHGKTYANLGRDDDVLEIGGNRAIDLIVAKESGAGGGRRGGDAGRPLGEDPETGKTISVKAGRYGPYVTDGVTHATLPKNVDPEALALDEAVILIQQRRAAGGSKAVKGRAAKPAAKKAAVKPAAGAAKAAAKPKAAPKKAAPKKAAPKKAAAKASKAAG